MSAISTRGPLVYLATPYTEYPRGPHAAFIRACEIKGQLIRVGLKVYSPIVSSHMVAIYGGLPPFDHDLWIPLDLDMLSRVDALMVAHMDGWDTSYGVREEVKFCERAGKPIFDLDPSILKWTRRNGAEDRALAQWVDDGGAR
jgi:hypothetical protein